METRGFVLIIEKIGQLEPSVRGFWSKNRARNERRKLEQRDDISRISIRQVHFKGLPPRSTSGDGIHHCNPALGDPRRNV